MQGFEHAYISCVNVKKVKKKYALRIVYKIFPVFRDIISVKNIILSMSVSSSFFSDYNLSDVGQGQIFLSIKLKKNVND